MSVRPPYDLPAEDILEWEFRQDETMSMCHNAQQLLLIDAPFSCLESVGYGVGCSWNCIDATVLARSTVNSNAQPLTIFGVSVDIERYAGFDV